MWDFKIKHASRSKKLQIDDLGFVNKNLRFFMVKKLQIDKFGFGVFKSHKTCGTSK